MWFSPRIGPNFQNRFGRILAMAGTPPNTGQARSDVVARQSGRARMPARKVLEDRVATRQLQEMMHAMDTSQANTRISNEISVLKDLIVALSDQVAQIAGELTATKNELTVNRDELTATRNELTATKNELVATKSEVEALKTEMTATIQTQLSSIQVPANASPSYAAIARTPPTSQPSNLPSFSSRSLTPSSMTDTLYCTIDTSRMTEEDKSKAQPGTIRKAIKKEMRTQAERNNWRCTPVTRDPRNTARIRVTCRDEAELQLVKEGTQKGAAPGLRVLRDQLYPVKIDNANRAAVLDQDGSIRPEAAEVFGKENEERIAKMIWLSKKQSAKAYGSMVIYVTKGSDAVRLLQGQYFHIAGESAYTSVYELRTSPVQCYNCQAIGHKAFSCTKNVVCGKCATEGHHHRECLEEVPKCVPCGGSHESFSKNCRLLHPKRHE